MKIVTLALLVLVSNGAMDEKPLYKSSVVGTEYDFIREKDADVFLELKFVRKGEAEMPDKSDEKAQLMQQAFLFAAQFRDGTSVQIAVDADFEAEDEAQKEALRYTPRLGKLPSALRRGVRRLVVQKGGVDTTAFSDLGLIVVYSDNATKRIGTHDLEETIFHESVHAAWDKEHAASTEWLEAQKKDGGFITEYAKKNPNGEDLAESALFAYTLLHHPDRIPKDDAAKIRRAIPARIAFVAKLLPAGKPIHFVVCMVDLSRSGQMSDILSNALIQGLKKDRKAVREFLDVAQEKHSKGEDLLQATRTKFEIDEATLRAKVKEYQHCNCTHGEVGSALPPEKK